MKAIDDYLATLPMPQRKALEELKEQIHAADPELGEHFGYGMPGFKFRGHPVVYFGAAKAHCALYGSVPAGFEERLKDFRTSKGAIQFTPGKPLPGTLVKAIVKAKCAEIKERWPMRGSGTKGKGANVMPGNIHTDMA